MKKNDSYFAGKLLVAMPGMEDVRFYRAVIYLCAHDEHGAMGLIINQPLPDLEFGELLGQIKLSEGLVMPEETNALVHVMHGGPVEGARGFLLHSNDFSKPDTVKVDDRIYVTGTLDALCDVALGDGPLEKLFVLGYAGWTAGQLDEELQNNAWLVADADPALVFDHDTEGKWERAVKTLGIDPFMLASAGGRA
jgi:putative transcriptional regulator